MTVDEIYNEYYSALLDTMGRSGIQLRRPRQPYSGPFQIIDSWPDQTVDSAVSIRVNEIRVDVTLKGEKADVQYLKLKGAQEEIEEIVGQKLDWRSTPPHERQIIAVLENADARNRSDWPRQHAWLVARLVAFRLAFGPKIEAWQT